VSVLAVLLMLAPGCELRDRPAPARLDAAAVQPDARRTLAPDLATAKGPTADGQPTVDTQVVSPSGAVCPAPCPPMHDCVAIFPDTSAGICLKQCTYGCGPCGGGPGWSSCSQCQVEISGIKYCMDFCAWKGTNDPCPDPVNQDCVDAYSIPNGLLSPDYPGSRVCVPR